MKGIALAERPPYHSHVFLQMIVYDFVGIMSPNVGRSKSATIKEEIKNILEVPSFIGQLKKACISQIKQKLWKRLQRWKRKNLSQGGKEVFIKEVA